MYLLDELSRDVTRTGAGIGDVQAATEAAMEKLLTRHAGSELAGGIEVTGGSVSDIATQLFETVLGLAAIALRYGTLHPTDRDIGTASASPKLPSLVEQGPYDDPAS